MSEQPQYEPKYYRGKCPQGGEWVFSTEKLRFTVDPNNAKMQQIPCPNHRAGRGVSVPVSPITDEEWAAKAKPGDELKPANAK